jgi:hypothetical protein
MLRYLMLIAAGLGFSILIAVAAAVQRPLVRLFKAILIGLVSLLAVMGMVGLVAGLTGDSVVAIVVGSVALLLAILLGRPLMRRRRPSHPRELEHVPLTRAPPDARWTRFERDLDWVARQQARQSRAAIERFLAEKDSPSLSHEHKALMISCERRVPELIDACLERCRNAKRHERERYMDDTLDRLVHIAGEAEQARLEVREADDARLRILHRYFDDVSKEKPKGPRN